MNNQILFDFLYNTCDEVIDLDATSVSIVAELPNGNVMCAYHNVPAMVKMQHANHITVDAMDEVYRVNHINEGDDYE